MLVSCIDQVSADGILGAAEFDSMPTFSGLEAMAQIAALHVRHCLDFARHAFLLKINSGQWPAQRVLHGCCRLSADLYSRSSSTFAYQTKVRSPAGMVLNADLLIGTIPFDGNFREELLKAHYRKLFTRLRKNR